MNQRTSPCSECPFSRACPPGELGGAPVSVYIAQAILGFWLPCHKSSSYRGKESLASECEQCAGAAMFRTAIGRPPTSGLLSLQPDSRKSFSSIADFYAHHTGCTMDEAREATPVHVVQEWMRLELGSTKLKMQLVPRK